MITSARQCSIKTVHGSSLRILIADDHEVVRRGIRSVLEDRSEWQICGEAATGSEAIEKAELLRPGLVLLDVTLPDMDAEKAIAHVVGVCPTVKIVALTHQDSAESATNAIGAGAHGLVLKSEAASDLLLAVESVGRGQSFLSPAAVMLVRSQLRRIKTSGATLNELTPRELQVLEALAKGQSNKQVAGALRISVKTVNAHRGNIKRKLKLSTFSDLVRFAIRHGVIKTQ